MTTNLSATFSMFRAILMSLLIVLAMSQISIRLAHWLKLVDIPGVAPHKQHTRPTPLAGGIALALTLLIAEWMFGAFQDHSIQVTFLAGAIVFLFGLWDDKKNIRPLIKLCGQVLAALVAIHLGVYIRIFESPEFFLHGSDTLNLYLDWALTVVWIVGITNAFNFVDSMDSLAVGLGGIAAAFFMLVTLDAGQPLLSQHSALIIGATIGLYFFNSPPAMLFLGDSGAQVLGFILSILAIVYRPQGVNQSSSWFVPILLLGVPIFDTTLVVFSRLRRGKPIYQAGRDHTYHRLLKLGLEPFRAVLVMQIGALALGCLAFICLAQPPLTANLIFASMLLLGILAITFLDSHQV